METTLITLKLSIWSFQEDYCRSFYGIVKRFCSLFDLR